MAKGKRYQYGNSNSQSFEELPERGPGKLKRQNLYFFHFIPCENIIMHHKVVSMVLKKHQFSHDH